MTMTSEQAEARRDAMTHFKTEGPRFSGVLVIDNDPEVRQHIADMLPEGARALSGSA